MNVIAPPFWLVFFDGRGPLFMEMNRMQDLVLDVDVSGRAMKRMHIAAPVSGHPICARKYLVQNAFFDLPLSFVARFAAHYKVDEVSEKEDLFPIIRKCVDKFFPGASLAEKLEIMCTRPALGDGFDNDLVDWDADVASLCEPGDLQDLERIEQKERASRENMGVYRKACQKMHAAVLKDAGGGGEGVAPGAPVDAHGMKMKPPSLEGSLPFKEALRWMPAGSRLLKDIPERRWRAQGRFKYDISRAFLRYGEVPAFALVCKGAWLNDVGKCPHAWVNTAVKDCIDETA